MYRREELEMRGIKIESMNMDKLMTYFEQYDALINNAVTVENMKDGRSFNIKARQYRLNYRPFTYRININSDKETKMSCRIFLGPAGRTDEEYNFLFKNYNNFFQLDRFTIHCKKSKITLEKVFWRRNLKISLWEMFPKEKLEDFTLGKVPWKGTLKF